MKCFISPKRIRKEDRDSNLFYYAIRHTDNQSRPFRGYTLEMRVMVNHYADVVTDFEVKELIHVGGEFDPIMLVTDFFEKYNPEKVKNIKDMYE